jgi:fatty-acyl-CoA synthase
LGASVQEPCERDDLPETLSALLTTAVAERPAGEIVDADGSVSFRTLERRVAGLAGGLLDWGVERGDHVGVWMPNCIDWLTVWFAVARVGATLVPLNTRFTVRELEYVLGQSRTKWLVRDDGVGVLDGRTTRQLRESLPRLQTARRQPSATDGEPALVDLAAGAPVPTRESVDQVGMIQYTSGSTAFPKGAMLRNAALIRNGYGLGRAWQIRRDDRVLCVNPLFHCGGSVFAFMAGFSHHAACVLMPRWSVTEAAAAVEHHRITVLPAIDAMIRDLLDHVRVAESRLDTLRLVATPSDATLLSEIVDVLGCEVSNVYGLTECSPNVAVGDLNESREVRIALVGRPQPGLEVSIRNATDRRVMPADTIGIITVRGWSVMLGYFDDPVGTAAALDDEGFLWTGDLGSLDREGRLRYLGRAKQMIKSGGENVSIEEVEACLREHPSVSDAVVVPIADRRLGEVGFAVVRLHQGQDVDSAAILDHCRGRLAGFKIPRHCVIAEDLPRVGSGKIDRRALAEWAAQQIDAPA